MAVRYKMTANNVLDAFQMLLTEYGKAKSIRSENGQEFIAVHLQNWWKRLGIKLMQIYSSFPWENGYKEGLTGH